MLRRGSKTSKPEMRVKKDEGKEFIDRNFLSRSKKRT